MFFRSPHVNVSITVQGDVHNSDIVGVTLSPPTGGSTKITADLFRYLFVEYLALPSLLELRSKLAIRKAVRAGQYAEVDSVIELWRGFVQHVWRSIPPPLGGHDGTSYHSEHSGTGIALPREGVVVKLRNVLVSSFVNRVPGYQCAYPTRNFYIRESSLLPEERDILVGGDLITAEDCLVRQFGLGDIRFGAVDDTYLLSLLDAQPGLAGLDRFGLLHRSPRDLGAMHMKSIFEGHPWFGYSMTAFGFPLVVTSLVHAAMSDLLIDYGAAFVSEITGVLRAVPAERRLSWQAGVPRVALCVEDRSNVKGVTKPRPFLGSAWTVVANHDHSRCQFAHWPFLIGLAGYHEKIREATNIINEEASKRELQPLFEFDSRCNWFSGDAPFTPQNMIELYRSLQDAGSVMAQKYRQDAVRTVQASTEIFLTCLREAYENELTESWRGALHDANLLWAEGMVQLRSQKFQSAQERFSAAVVKMPSFTWAHLFAGICSYFAGNKKDAEVALHAALECAVDDLLQDHNTGPGYSLRNTYSKWYLMLWLWYDYVRREAGSPVVDSGGFCPLSKEEVWNPSSEKRLSDEANWLITLDEFSPTIDRYSIDQVWTYWLGSELRLPFDAEVNWLAQFCHWQGENTCQAVRVESSPSDWPLLRSVARTFQTTFGGKVLVKYPKYTTTTQKKIQTASFDEAVACSSSQSWRERRHAELRLIEIGDAGRLGLLLGSKDPSIRRMAAFVLGQVASRGDEVPAIVTALSTRLQMEKTRFVVVEILRACGYTRASAVVPCVAEFLRTGMYVTDVTKAASEALVTIGGASAGALVELLADEGSEDYSADRAQDVLESLASDAQPALIRGLGHTSPSVRGRCASLLGGMGTQDAIPALINLVDDDAGECKRGRNRAIAERAISAIRSRLSKIAADPGT
jgi:hypothetical protein